MYIKTPVGALLWHFGMELAEQNPAMTRPIYFWLLMVLFQYSLNKGQERTRTITDWSRTCGIIQASSMSSLSVWHFNWLTQMLSLDDDHCKFATGTDAVYRSHSLVFFLLSYISHLFFRWTILLLNTALLGRCNILTWIKQWVFNSERVRLFLFKRMSAMKMIFYFFYGWNGATIVQIIEILCILLYKPIWCSNRQTPVPHLKLTPTNECGTGVCRTYKQMWYRPFTRSTETAQGTDCGGYAVPF